MTEAADTRLEITEQPGNATAAFDYVIRAPEALPGQHFIGHMGYHDNLKRLSLVAEVTGPYVGEGDASAPDAHNKPIVRVDSMQHPPEFNMSPDRRREIIRGLVLRIFESL